MYLTRRRRHENGNGPEGLDSQFQCREMCPSGRASFGLVRSGRVRSCHGGEVIVVVMRGRALEDEIRLEVNDGLSVTSECSLYGTPSGDGKGELIHPSLDRERLRLAVTSIEREGGWSGGSNQGPSDIGEGIKIGGWTDGVVGGGGKSGMRTAPHVDLIFVDGGVGAGLEGGCVVACHVKESCVIKAVNPILGVGLSTFDGSNIVRLAIVIPGEDFDHLNLITVLDKGVPAIRESVPVTAGIDEVLVEGVSTIVSEEVGADGSHVGLGSTRADSVQAVDVRSVGGESANNCRHRLAGSTKGTSGKIGEVKTDRAKHRVDLLFVDFDGPSAIPVQGTVHNTGILAKTSRINEERRDEIHLVATL